jgi:Arc/MetJ family transcription regulator
MMYKILKIVCIQEHIMRTTINVKDDLMESLMKRARVSSKTKAVELAIIEYLEKQAIEDLIALSGQIRIDLDWEKEEEAELNEYRDHR